MSFDVVVVADKARVALAAALNILVSRKTCPEANFTVAIPEDSDCEHAVAEDVIRSFATNVIEIPAPRFQIEGHHYRIENKINALRYFGNKPVIGADADLIFIRPLPAAYLFRRIPAAVPEHGLHVYPWEELYSMLELRFPDIKVLTASGEVGAPWLNAGFVVCPDGFRIGSLWHRACQLILHCDWVPERFPYLDQIALPLAFAQASPCRTVTFENILPARFNQNIFYWADEQHYVNYGYVVHHHYRVKLIEKYLSRLITWTKADYPVVDKIIDAMRIYDDQPNEII